MVEFQKINNEYYKQLVKRGTKNGMFICSNSSYYSYDPFLYIISPEDYEKYEKGEKLVYENEPFFELDTINDITGEKNKVSMLSSEYRDRYFETC